MKFVILHGTDSDSSDAWFPWLKDQLEKLGHEVWVPDLPGADAPKIDKYNEFLLASGWDFNENVIIGHSSGSVAISGLLQSLPETVNLTAAFYVGTFRGDLGWDVLHGVDIPFNYEYIRKMAKRFVVIHSDNDPYCPLEGAKWIAEQLNAEFILMPGMQHFSRRIDERFAEFPELLEIIKERVS